jgi:NitT/TauT family transport system substrate-binding protein
MLCVAAAALVVAGCGSGDESSDSTASQGSGSGGDLPTVKIIAPDNGPAPLVALAMTENKLDEKHGFKADVTYSSNEATAQAFLQRESDVSFDYDPYGAAIARAEGHEISSFLEFENNFLMLMVPTDSGATSPEDLVGKKIGHYGLDSSGMGTFAYMMRKLYDIDVFKDFELVLGAPQALPQLLKQGQVDAILDFSPYTEQVLVNDIGKIIWNAPEVAEQENLFIPGFVYASAYQEWLCDNQDAAGKLVAAMGDAYKLFEDSNYKILGEEPYRSYLNLDETPDVLEAYIENAPTFPLYSDPKLWDEQAVEEGYAFYKEIADMGILIEEVPPEGTLTTVDMLPDLCGSGQ